MKGLILAVLGGAFLTLQGVANARISQDIGAWQMATITQWTGFIICFLILLFSKNKSIKVKSLSKVKPLYLIGGTFGAIVVFSNATAMQYIGVTITVALLLIAQLCLTFTIDARGWFEIAKKKVRISQCLGIGLMIAGVIILRL
ncbi:DMT family transporter [Longirhabdus pacifica]|uniref:DMT family transporter n=1 Tax=Longirhabdus pacifica TaxID=2305227 RepID=UPI0010089995|nr:DMT family transporter [Longirhabdus pacifica]